MGNEYLALYRKYRPTTFDEIVGQKAIVKALQNQVKYGQIGHAYLFCGTRGTGKTSTAKVFARAVNCLHPIDGNPCNECELCKESESGFNLIEIDAASNNSVDDIRTLREEVQYTPSKGKYKVYIIDEVHMLSPSAFNALLKTLEEPPEHVIFVLATTDPQRLLATIVSRCQRYNFKRITTEEIKEHLLRVCKEESIDAEESALHYIAALSDGGMRDALSLLDQCRAYYMDETITLHKVQDVLGAMDDAVFTDLTEALQRKDTKALLQGVDKAFEDGRDAVQFVDSWTRYLRNVLVVKALGDASENALIEAEENELSKIKEQAKSLSTSLLTSWIEQLSALSGQLKTASSKRILIEVSMIKLVVASEEAAQNPSLQGTPDGNTSMVGQLSSADKQMISNIDQRLKRLEQTAAQKFSSNRSSQGGQASGYERSGELPKIKADRVKPSPCTDAEMQAVIDKWPEILKVIAGKDAARIFGYLTLEPGDEPGTLYISSPRQIFVNQLKEERRLNYVQQALKESTGKDFRLIPRYVPTGAKLNGSDIQNRIQMDVKTED